MFGRKKNKEKVSLYGNDLPDNQEEMTEEAQTEGKEETSPLEQGDWTSEPEEEQPEEAGLWVDDDQEFGDIGEEAEESSEKEAEESVRDQEESVRDQEEPARDQEGPTSEGALEDNEEEEPEKESDREDGGDKRRSKKKTVMVVAAVVLVAIVLFFVMRNFGNSNQEKVYVQSVQTICGYGSSNGMSNRFTGTVDSQNAWNITLSDNMSVEKAYVKVGDTVKKGDRLFKYNTEQLKLSLDKTQLEIQSLNNEIAELTKDIAKYEGEMGKADSTKKINLETQILTAKTTIKKDQSTLESDKKQVKQIKKNIGDATVRSKMDGVVKNINDSNGSAAGGDDSDDMTDTGSGSGSASAGNNVYMTVLAVGNYRIKAKASETNIWQLAKGEPMIVRSRINEKETWKGTISDIKTTQTTTSDAAEADTSLDGGEGGDSSTDHASSYYFYVALNDDNGLMMGQHVLVEKDNGQDKHKSGIWLPSAYVLTEGDHHYVWAANSRGRLEKREITTGEYDSKLEEYEVKDGLKLSDYIAYNAKSLKEGMVITKTAPKDSTEGYEDSTGEAIDEDSQDLAEDLNDSNYYEEQTSDDDMIFDASGSSD